VQPSSPEKSGNNSSTNHAAGAPTTMTGIETTPGTAKNTDTNNKESIAEGIGHDSFFTCPSDDEASTTASVNHSARKKNRASMMRKHPTAQEHLDVIHNNIQTATELFRSKKKSERLTARRNIPMEDLDPKKNNSIGSDCDTLANGLNDRPTVWEKGVDDDTSSFDYTSSVEFDCMSRSGGDDDDHDSLL
jgi:hypothetical protein